MSLLLFYLQCHPEMVWVGVEPLGRAHRDLHNSSVARALQGIVMVVVGTPRVHC